MDKYELVGITLDRLIDHFASSPESFEYYDCERNPGRLQASIYWQPKVQLNDYMSTVIEDPNNNHAVIVTFHPHMDEVTCFLFLKAPANLVTMSGALADCTISSKRWFERWRGNYRKFRTLRDMIIKRDKLKENMNYLKKLSSVFPDSMDDHFYKN